MTSFSSTSSVEIRRHSANAQWSYTKLDEKQREVASRIHAGGEGALLLSELASVITVGRRTPGSDLLVSKDDLKRVGTELISVDRGGFATWHGPGQWVLFPVEKLERLTGDPRGVRKAVEGLLEVARRTGEHFGVPSEIKTGCEMGVWSPRGKFAAVGVHIENGVLLHGLSINGFKTPQSFQGLKPCGLDLPVDYLIETSPEHFEELRDVLLRSFAEVFH